MACQGRRNKSKSKKETEKKPVDRPNSEEFCNYKTPLHGSPLRDVVCPEWGTRSVGYLLLGFPQLRKLLRVRGRSLRTVSFSQHSLCSRICAAANELMSTNQTSQHASTQLNCCHGIFFPVYGSYIVVFTICQTWSRPSRWYQ